MLLVQFDNAHEIITGEIIDTGNHFEDRRKTEVTNTIQVHQANVEGIGTSNPNSNFSFTNFLALEKNKDKYCWGMDCKRKLSLKTNQRCEICTGLICDCGRCFCPPS